MSKLTAFELEAEQDRAKARHYFWWWLGVTTTVSLGGNVAHALLTHIPAEVVKVAVALVPPAVALAAIHGLAVLARCGGVERRDRVGASSTYWSAVAVTAALAMGALVLSFDALRGFALAAGVRPAFAGVWPLIIDAGIAVSSFALVVLRPATAADIRAARVSVNAQVKLDDVSPNAIASTPSSATPARRGAAETATLSASTAIPKRAAGSATPASATITDRDSATLGATQSAVVSADDATRELAAELVARKATRQSVDTVVAILAAHKRGHPPNRIAENVGKHHSSVSRVIQAADHRQRELASVG